ncbi:MAG: SRPBCC domain-containing protein [Bryobacteraceae bacterium]
MANETKTIRQTAFIPGAKPVQVYDCMVNAKKHAEFTGSDATSENKVGGKMTAWGGYISGTWLDLDRSKRIVQEWETSEWPEGYAPSRLEFTFTEKDGGTEIVMEQSEVPASQAESYRQGWIDYYWTPLQEYFSK